MADDNVLLSSIIQHDRGDGCVSFSLMGNPHAAAMVEAVIYDYEHVTGRHRPTTEELLGLVGSKVTVTLHGESTFGASSIQAKEGTVFAGRSGTAALLPKGKRKNGIRLNNVLDVEMGYNHVDVLRKRVEKVRGTFPPLEALTTEHLAQLPRQGRDVKMAVVGTWRGPDDRSPGAIWLITNYDAEDDIVEGALIVRGEHGVSEHGSCYGKDLVRFGGMVVGFPGMSFAQAIDLTDADYHRALETVTGLCLAPA